THFKNPNCVYTRMQTLKSFPNLSLSHLYNLPQNPFFFHLFSSLAKTPNPILFDYLIKTLKFSKTQALSVSTRYSHIKSLEQPQSLCKYLQSIGFSNTHIQSSIKRAPQLLFAKVDKTLKPKIEFLKNLGIVGLELVHLISKSSMILNASLEKRIVPCIEILKEVLVNDGDNKGLVKVLLRSNRIMGRDPKSFLLSNIALFESYGIVGSQLATLLSRNPRLFVMQESVLRDLLLKVSKMGFSADSRMFVHGVYALSCVSDETFERKFGVFKSFGFSIDDFMGMIRQAPPLLRSSEEKLKLGIVFFLDSIKLKKKVLVRRPTILLYSMEERIIPRYRILDLLKSKKLLRRDPSFLNVLYLTDNAFLEKYVSRFRDCAEELLVVYEGHILDPSSEGETA
ncbi:unnamed protein product, partial [Dovyalis caffra]